MKRIIFHLCSGIILLIFASFLSPPLVSAHCDTLDGPVVAAAKKAMATDNANYILIWVKPENEDEIRKALKRAREKLKSAKSKEDKEKAEMELFEILVRVHREGEGAHYEGVKPAGSLEPVILLADKAVETGSVDNVLTSIASVNNKEIIRHLFHELKEKSHFDIDNVPAGREYIEAYVTFIHAVEKAVNGTELHPGHLHEH